MISTQVEPITKIGFSGQVFWSKARLMDGRVLDDMDSSSLRYTRFVLKKQVRIVMLL